MSSEQRTTPIVCQSSLTHEKLSPNKNEDWKVVLLQTKRVYKTKNKNKKKKPQMTRNDLIEIEDSIAQLNVKDQSRQLYARHHRNDGKRNNKKEAKRRGYLIRMAKKARKLDPHGEDPTCDPPGQYVQTERVEERNNLARIAVEVPAQSMQSVANDVGFQEILTSLSTTLEASENEEVDQWISHLENVVLYAWNLHKADSCTDVFMATMSYIKTCTTKSIIKVVGTVIDSLVASSSEPLEAQADWDGQTVLRGWEAFRANPIFSKISYLISAAMSFSVCSMKKIEWDILGFKVVAIEAMKEQANAVDVMDAVIKTFNWMADTGYRCIQTRSLMPILYGDNAIREFNDECDYVLAHAETALAGNGDDVLDFEHKVDNVLRTVCEMKAAKSDGPTGAWLQKKYSELVGIKQRIVAKHRNTSIREAPFGIGITGPSGVGKSTLAQLSMKVALTASDIEFDEKRIITRDMFDQYDSTYTSDIQGMFMDDVGNGKKEFAKTSPTDIIIKFFNNMAAQAVKAELNAKGVVFINFKVGVMTSNFHDYGVRHYAEKPEASLRRFIHVRVAVKEEFRKAGGISLDTDNEQIRSGDLTQDIWKLTIEECHIFESKTGKESYAFRVMTVPTLDGRKIYCKDLDLKDYLIVLASLAKKHKSLQKTVVSRTKDFNSMAMCKTSCLPARMCQCPNCPQLNEKLEPHALEEMGEVVIEAGLRALRGYVTKWWTPVRFANSLLGYRPIGEMATRQLSNEFSSILRQEFTPWMVAMTPEWLFQTSLFQRSVDMWQKSAAMYDVKKPLRRGTLCVTALMLYYLYTQQWKYLGAAFFLSWFGTIFLWMHYLARLRHYRDAYLSRRSAVPEFAREWRESTFVKGTIGVVAIGVLLKFLVIWNKKRIEAKKLESNGGSLSVENIEKQDSWFGYMFKMTGIKAVAKGDTTGVFSDDMVRAFKKNNLFYAKYKFPSGRETGTNIWFPRKNVAIIPYHVFFPGNIITNTVPDMNIEVTVYRHQNASGGIFTFKSDETTCVVSKYHDLVMMYMPLCPDFRDRTEWLVKENPTGSGFCHFLNRYKDEYQTQRVYVNFTKESHKQWLGSFFWGGRYNTTIAKPGTCMGLIMTDQKEPCIVGFHIAGSTSEGTMQTLTHASYSALLEALRSQPGVFLSAQADEIPGEQYAKPVIVSTTVHEHAKASKLEPHAVVDVLGSTKLRTEQKSVVEKSLISDKVKEHMGISNEWGAPKLRPNWKAYNTNLDYIVDPSDMFVPRKLERARDDWLEPLLAEMKKFSAQHDFRPLTFKETILGIDGMRFIDAMPMSTSMGFPVFGPKSKWFEEVRDGERLIDRIPDVAVLEECDRMLSCWKRGVRAYPVTSATLKDEPTPVSSEKVRVFQAASVAMSIWIRMYFLPIARFLQLHPELAETAVGVNAFSKQWEDLMAHTHKFSDDEVVALDYSKFDVRMNSQITTAAWRSFIDLARAGGYCDEDLNIMQMMIADIVHPLIDFNGTMLMAFSMNTSGNNLTVNVNSTVNSLYLRLCFFDVYPEASDFRSAVAVMTYGDDMMGTVHEDYRQFNFKSIKAILQQHGIKVTPPDKSDIEYEFMESKKADFLKRQSQYIPEIKCSIGRLALPSIYKSLHANLRSKGTTKRQVAISCIECAMHEMFAHGEEEYVKFQEGMKKVCSDLDMLVPAVQATYQERVLHWLAKYRPSELDTNSIEGTHAQSESNKLMTEGSGCYAATQY